MMKHHREPNYTNCRFIVWVSALITLTVMGCNGPPPTPTPTSTSFPVPTVNTASLYQKLTNLCWVAYAPTHYNPDRGQYPLPSDIRDDLKALWGIGFRGIVTYGSDKTLGRIPDIAREVGFEGVIMGIWIPTSKEENANAREAAKFVDGYVIGNEGLGDKRYSYDDLKRAMDSLKAATGKPVATSERVGAYHSDSEKRLLSLGDWLFPIAHPYWHEKKDPKPAVDWTQSQFEDLGKAGSKLPLILKEIGLPSGGDPAVSETKQAEYYSQLQKTSAKFVYFEAFDSPWKVAQRNIAVEAHWGMLNADRSPKRVSSIVCGGQPLSTPAVVGVATPAVTPTMATTAPRTATPIATNTAAATVTRTATPVASNTVAATATSTAVPTSTPARTNTPTFIPPPTPAPTNFFVYVDYRDRRNHFVPSGYIGDTGDIELVEDSKDTKHSGETSIKVVYRAVGDGPVDRKCGNYDPPCNWAGVYWQAPELNWCDKEGGFNLTGAKRLSFWAKGLKGGERIEFKVGGIKNPAGAVTDLCDSIQPAFSKGVITLSNEWKAYSIDLTGKDLRHVIGGFLWVAPLENNPNGATFYLDDIVYEFQ